MDTQYRLTEWHEWRLGDKYLHKKARLVKRPDIQCECIEINQDEGFVRLQAPSGETITHYDWQGCWIWVCHYVLAGSRSKKLGVKRICNLRALEWWVQGKIAKFYGQACSQCWHFENFICKCLHPYQMVLGECQHTRLIIGAFGGRETKRTSGQMTLLPRPYYLVNPAIDQASLRKCSWCGIWWDCIGGLVTPIPEPVVSHGICQECYLIELDKFRAGLREEVAA